ncbi:asparagine synthase-related protein [Nonomuraea thailandensis]
MAADRAVLLAALDAAGLDPDQLLLRLLPCPPPSLPGAMWKGVHAVPPGEAVRLSPRGPAVHSRWWRPPEPALGIDRTAPCRALAGSVACRVRPGEPIAADLSGGLDSTPLCFLAEAAARERGARLITVRQLVDDAAHDDELWARPAAGLLDGEHLTVAPAELPARYAAVAVPVEGLDEPLMELSTLPRLTACAALLARHGARVHLAGHGGDQVTTLPSNMLHDLVGPRPRAWWPQLRQLRAQRRWPLAATLTALAERRSYPAWLARQAGLLTTPFPRPHQPYLGWDGPLRLPSWIHRDAAARAAHLLRQAGEHARPLAGSRAQHLTLAAIRHLATSMGQIHRLTARHGAALHLPYLDTPVIDACLATRLDHRARPGAFKPLTVAAMTGRMPAQCLRRTTKADFSSEAFTGLRRHRDQILALAGDSRLAGLGLADAALLDRPAGAPSWRTIPAGTSSGSSPPRTGFEPCPPA